MSFLTDALDELVATLVSVGETVADSAAAIRPPVAVVDPPTVSTVSGSISTVDWLVTLTEQPPGSDRAVRRLLDRVAAIGAVLPISSASPTVYSVAGTDLPGMSLTIQLTYRSVVPPWTPLELDPVLWLDAADTATITEAAGFVSQWDDKSTSGLAAAEGVQAYQPITGSRTLNGRNVIDFDGTLDRLIIPAFAVEQPFSVFTVAYQDVSQSGRYFQTLPNVVASFQPGDRPFQQAGLGNPYGYSGSTPPGFTYLMENTFADPGSRIVVNRRPAFAGTCGTNNPNGEYWVGSGINTQRFNGVLAEMIVVDRLLSSAETRTLENYLAGKWGITLP